MDMALDSRACGALTDGRGRSSIHVIALVIALVLSACGGKDSPSADNSPDASSDTIADEGDPVDGGSLVFAVSQETTGWNPTIDRWAQGSALVGSAILEPLTRLDADAQ